MTNRNYSSAQARSVNEPLPSVNDETLIQRLLPLDSGLRESYSRHRRLERQLSRLGPITEYSAFASIKRRQLKKLKLREKDRIAEIVRRYQTS